MVSVKNLKKMKRRFFDIVQIGNRSDWASAFFDYFIVAVIAINLFVTIYETYDSSVKYKGILEVLECATTIVFVIEYAIRIWTSNYLYPNRNPFRAALRYIFSLFGIIDLLAILPFFLPLVFPTGAVAFRIFRVIRIFRLFRVNAQYDAFNVIIDIISEKRNQLFSSVCMITIFMIAASLCMYNLENAAQPGVFSNAFSGIWWSASTLLTVGYGDIYPITTAGKVMAIIISFLGVGMVAIPTGIISAGFVEQYTRAKNRGANGEEHELNFVVSTLSAGHDWCGKAIRDLTFPPQVMIVLIIRNGEHIVPKGMMELMVNDKIVMTAQKYQKNDEMSLREVMVSSASEWENKKIWELGLADGELILSIRRKSATLVPNGQTKIKAGDRVLIFSDDLQNKLL